MEPVPFPRQGTRETDDEILGLAAVLENMAQRIHLKLLVGCRRIAVEDEHALTALEIAPLADAVASVRRASGAGRILSRILLEQAGSGSIEHLTRLTSGAPAWPQGFVGSISHDPEFAVAAVARSDYLRSVGIDIEPRLPLPPELLELVATPSESHELQGDLLTARLLFSMKEAVYKATHPIDSRFLDHHDVEVCFSTGIAQTSTGHRLRVEVASTPRLLAIAAFAAQ
ncbi:4'-phosphopantetheinyl transferase family protein [Bradyrhizobium diazoefficiens]|uniref:4'-phosphopantetheinyl transferase family protein n=1 Tax=Bradyrhizobium diazoefficiens TaxID=1355477 RepID=UPI001B4FECFB|nr:4'-phosphopantetheinyl transferase EntD [Bradyrhizobium japonicum]